jgi:predicted Zn-dependent protease
VSYQLTRERLRVLGASPEDNIRRYYGERHANQDQTPGEQYGEALANYQAGNSRASLDNLTVLAREYPQVPMLQSTLGQALMGAGATDEALDTFRRGLLLSPRNIPLTMRYAEALLKANQARTAHAVLLDLFNNVAPTTEQIRFTALAASSAGDAGDAAYYMSEYHISTGNLPLSVAQLEMALAAPNITGVQRSRFEARLAQSSWLVGDGPTAADFALVPQIGHLFRAMSKPVAQDLDLELQPVASRFPALAAWWDRIRALPGFERTYPPHWK